MNETNDKRMQTWGHYLRSARSAARHRWGASCVLHEWSAQNIWSARPPRSRRGWRPADDVTRQGNDVSEYKTTRRDGTRNDGPATQHEVRVNYKQTTRRRSHNAQSRRDQTTRRRAATTHREAAENYKPRLRWRSHNAPRLRGGRTMQYEAEANYNQTTRRPNQNAWVLDTQTTWRREPTTQHEVKEKGKQTTRRRDHNDSFGNNQTTRRHDNERAHLWAKNPPTHPLRNDGPATQYEEKVSYKQTT